MSRAISSGGPAPRRRSGLVLAVLLGAVVLSVGAPVARASGPSASPCTSDATPRPCYTAFTVGGDTPPAGLALVLMSAGGMDTMQLWNESGAPTLDLSGLGLTNDSQVHAVLDLGTYVPHFSDATGLVTGYSVDTSDPNHTLVTIDAQPRPSSWANTCTVVSCPQTATNDYGEMFLAAFADLSGAPDPSLVSHIDGSWVSTNAQAIQLPPTFDAGTGAFGFHIAAPHFESDSSTVNQGFFRAFLPDAVVEAMGIADPSTVANNSFEVANSNGGTVTVTVSHQADPAGVLIDAPLGSFTYSSPTITITKAGGGGGGGATLDHFAVTASGGGSIPAQTAGHPFLVKVTAEDSGNHPVTSFSGSVDLSANAACAVGCSSPVGGFSNGVATAPVSLLRARSGATVTATLHGGSKSGTSNAFTVSPAAASKLVFVGTSSASLVSGALRTLQVEVRDAYSNKVAAGSRQIAFTETGKGTVTSLPATVGSAGGTAAKAVTGALAGPVTIRASSGSLTAATIAFAVVPGAAAKLVFTSSTASLKVGTTRKLTVQVEDAAGNVVPSPSKSVTFARVTGPGAVTGLKSVTSSAGIASVTVTATHAGSITIRATSGSLTAGSSTFTISAS